MDKQDSRCYLKIMCNFKYMYEKKVLDITVKQFTYILKSNLFKKLQNDLLANFNAEFCEDKISEGTVNIYIHQYQLCSMVDVCNNIAKILNGYAECCTSCYVTQSTLNFLNDQTRLVFDICNHNDRIELIYTAGDKIQLKEQIVNQSAEVLLELQMKELYPLVDFQKTINHYIFTIGPELIEPIHELYECIKITKNTSPVIPVSSSNQFNQRPNTVSTSQHVDVKNIWLKIKQNSNSSSSESELQSLTMSPSQLKHIIGSVKLKNKIKDDIQKCNANLETISDTDNSINVVFASTVADDKKYAYITEMKHCLNKLAQLCVQCLVSQEVIDILSRGNFHFTLTEKKEGDNIEIIYTCDDKVSFIEKTDVPIHILKEKTRFFQDLETNYPTIQYSMDQAQNEIQFTIELSMVEKIHHFCLKLAQQNIERSPRSEDIESLKKPQTINQEDSKADKKTEVRNQNLPSKEIIIPPDFVRMFKCRPLLQNKIKKEFLIPFMSLEIDKLIIFPTNETKQLEATIIQEMFVKLQTCDERCLIYKKILDSLADKLHLAEEVLIEADDKYLTILGYKDTILEIIKEDMLESETVFKTKTIDILPDAQVIQMKRKLENHFQNNVIIKMNDKVMCITGFIDIVNVGFQTLPQNIVNGSPEDSQHCIDSWYVKLFKEKRDIHERIRQLFADKGYTQELNFRSNGQLVPTRDGNVFSALQSVIASTLDHKILQYDAKSAFELSDAWCEYMNFMKAKVIMERKDNDLHIVGYMDAVNEVCVNLRQFIKNIATGTLEVNTKTDTKSMRVIEDKMVVQHKTENTNSNEKDVITVAKSEPELSEVLQDIDYATIKQKNTTVRIVIGDPYHKACQRGIHLLLYESPIYKMCFSSSTRGKEWYKNYETLLVSEDCLCVFIKNSINAKELQNLNIKKYNNVTVMWDYKKKNLKLISSVLQLLVANSSNTVTILIPRKSINYKILFELEECVGVLEYSCGDRHMKIVSGEIQKQKTTIIVNSSNHSLILSDGAISSAILNAAGKKIQEECKKEYKDGISYDNIAVTSGGNTKFESIIHVNLPKYEQSTADTLQIFIKENLSRVLEVSRVNSTNTDKQDRSKHGFKAEAEIPESSSQESSYTQNNSREDRDEHWDNQKRSMSNNHESRCVILKFKLNDVSTSHIGNILSPEFSNNRIEPLCIVSPYEDDSCAAFISFKNIEEKNKACQLQLIKQYNIVDIQPELFSPVLFHVNIKADVLWKSKYTEQLATDLKSAAGVYLNINEDKTINIEGCQQQIKLVDTWFRENYKTISTSCTGHGGARPKDITTVTRKERTITISSLKYKALKHLHGKTMKSVFTESKTKEDKIQLLVHQNSEEKTYENLQDIIYSLKHEYIEIPEDKINEAYTFIDKYDNRQTLYFEVNDDTQCLHVLGKDYNEVETSIHKAKLAVGLLKVNDKNRFGGTQNKSDQSIKNKLQNKTFVSNGTGLRIHVQNTDITKLDVDVVVNAANGQLRHGAGVAYCISKAGGTMLANECTDYAEKHGDIPVSGICKTTGGDMKCKQVFHAVGPRWHDYSSKIDCEDDLCKTIIRCLVEADKDGYNSIAIPSISSAIFGVPEKICANMYWRGFKGFETFYHVTNLKDIYFVDIRDKMLAFVQSSFEMFLDTPLEETKITKIKSFINDISPEEKASNQDVMEASHTDFPMTITVQTLNSKPKMVCKLQSNVEFHIYQASVKSTTTQSIVSWEDKSFSSFNASSKWLLDSAGDDYKKERSIIKENGIAAGHVATTSAGQMAFTFIFHIASAISPSLQDMEQMIENLFSEVQKKNVKSVTIGLVPDEYQKLFTSILKYLKRKPRPPCLEEIHFVTEAKEEIVKLHEYCNRYVSRNNAAVSDAILECPICLDAINNQKTIPCGHKFCQECIDEAMKNSTDCPICRANVYGGIRTGNQPDGRMKIIFEKYNHLPGYTKCGAIVITYMFRDGIQTEKHPNPGLKYYGTNRTVYLPDNSEGREVLMLLQIAWDRKLVFTVGQSVTTGVDNAITWNEIHHKTNRHGGPESHGYPDPGYLQRVKQELLSLGVTAPNT